MILHGYFRSTATWRVRIALGLKGLSFERAVWDLRAGDQHRPEYLAINPQGLIPALGLDDGAVLTQSLAICEYLEEVHPEPPLLPRDPVARARVRAAALVIACDVHPLQNLKVLQRLRDLGQDSEGVKTWARTAIAEGFDAFDHLAAGDSTFAFGGAPTLADVLLVPQMANARRFGLEMRWPRLEAIEAACMALPAFAQAAPDRQPDAA